MMRNERYIANFKAEQKRAIKIARELFYGKAVIEQLKNAKTTSELSIILRTAREELMKQ